MIKYIPKHKFHPPKSQSMHVRHLRGKLPYSNVHQLSFEHQVTPVAPVACDTNTFVQPRLGEKAILGMIVFSSMFGQIYEKCVGWKLPAFFFSFLLCTVVLIIHVPLYSGSLLLVMDRMMRQASGWLSLMYTKMDGHAWL